jgi:hypothetical protein
MCDWRAFRRTVNRLSTKIEEVVSTLERFQAKLDKFRWFQWRTGKSKKNSAVSGMEMGGEENEMSWQFVI